MYKRIVLAYDGSLEGRWALREGALLAKLCGAEAFLLCVLSESQGVLIAEAATPGLASQREETYRKIFAEGAARLRDMGFTTEAELVRGEPPHEIGAFAKRVGADLVVVGHRRQSLMSRWWSGSSGAYLGDHVSCSVLIGRKSMSDEMFVEAARP